MRPAVPPLSGDAAEFEAQKTKAAELMQSDAALTQAARTVLVEADRYGYTYQWTWLGLPVIQLPQDIVAIQEVVWTSRPTVIIETGIARGGSLILYASLLELIGEGKVVGVEIDMRPENVASIQAHPLHRRIHIIDGSSIDRAVANRVNALIQATDRVMVILDSNHTHTHVLEELRLYAPLVTVGQMLIVADTIVDSIPPQSHRPRSWGPGNNPLSALNEYLPEDGGLELDRRLENKLLLTTNPGGYLRRVRPPKEGKNASW